MLVDRGRGTGEQRLDACRERGEGRPSRLVWQREQKLAALLERAQKGELRRREIVESIGDHGSPVPGGELALETPRGGRQRRTGRCDPVVDERGVEGAIGLREPRVELAVRSRAVDLGTVDAAALELGVERLERRVERTRAASGRARHTLPQHASSHDIAVVARHASDPSSEGVERHHLATDQRARALADLALQLVALRRRGHEQRGPFARGDRLLEPVEDSTELAGTDRSDEKAQRHRPEAIYPSSCAGGCSSICFSTAALTTSMPSL